LTTPPQSNITPVQDALIDQEDPNIVLFNLIKNDWGADVRQNFKYQKAKVRFMTEAEFYDGGATPCIVVWWIGDDVGRWGVKSGKRYVHTRHIIHLFARSPDERFQCKKEINRILQKYAVNPSPAVLRVDFYKWQGWQQESPVQKLYRAKCMVTCIYVM